MGTPAPEIFLAATHDQPAWLMALVLFGVLCTAAVLIYLALMTRQRNKRDDEEMRARALDRLTRICDGCGGAGTVNRIVDDENDGAPRRVKCPKCNGRGRIMIGDAPSAPTAPRRL